jgi:predicted nucleotidyltransferase
MDKKLENALEKIKEVLSKRPEVLAAYLYGSHAKGYAREGSDLDIAILTVPDFEIPGYNYQFEIEGLLNDVVKDFEVEAVVVDFMSLPLKHSSVVQGNLVYSKDDLLRAREQVKILYDYEDLKDFYDLRLKSNLEGAKNYLKERGLL